MRVPAALVILAAAAPAFAAPGTIDALRWQRRVVLVSAPDPHDPRIAVQRRILAGWREGAQDRDVAFVSVAGDRVEGSADAASALRRRYRLDPAAFAALLIGKDGHVAMRAAAPIAADRLQGAIDAMPMRRAGQR